jgi:hypothetical protein
MPARELYRPSDRRMSTKLVPTFADRGCRVVPTDGSLQPYSRLSRPYQGAFFPSFIPTAILYTRTRTHTHTLSLAHTHRNALYLFIYLFIHSIRATCLTHLVLVDRRNNLYRKYKPYVSVRYSKYDQMYHNEVGSTFSVIVRDSKLNNEHGIIHTSSLKRKNNIVYPWL